MSPTHVRVTAGGRIVPNTRAIGAPLLEWNNEKQIFEPGRQLPEMGLQPFRVPPLLPANPFAPAFPHVLPIGFFPLETMSCSIMFNLLPRWQPRTRETSVRILTVLFPPGSLLLMHCALLVYRRLLRSRIPANLITRSLLYSTASLCILSRLVICRLPTPSRSLPLWLATPISCLTSFHLAVSLCLKLLLR